MKRIYFLICALLFLSCGNSETKRYTTVSINGEKFCINGVETFKGKSWRGHSIEGLLPNSRMVNGIFDDENPETIKNWIYPDTKVWDAERNSREFVEAMPLWRESGLLAFTINLQGGSPYGYSKEQTWINSAITPAGELKESYMNRLEQILDKADQLGMVVILGLFYQGQEKNIDDEAAVYNGIRNSVEWVLRKGYTNVMIEINNECNYYKKHAILNPKNVHKAIEFAQNINIDGKRLLVSTSYGGGRIPSSKVVKCSDYILIHGNGQHTSEKIKNMINKTRDVEGYTPKPVVINEDDHFKFELPENNFVTATSMGVSWGYFDFRKSDEPFEVGYQCVPASWGIDTERKAGFFNLLKEW